MGTRQVSYIVERARYLIQDDAGVRWTDPELIAWLNDGLKELVVLKPTANSLRINQSLAPGVIQPLPSGTLHLLRATHNAVSGKPCRLVDIDRLDATEPGWRALGETKDADHYIYDATVPLEFQVYPPNDGTGALSITVARPFTDLTALTNTVPADDVYVPVLVDYLLYRAYSKHSKFAGNEQRAAAAYNRFRGALGARLQFEAALDPHTTNKNQQKGIE